MIDSLENDCIRAIDTAFAIAHEAKAPTPGKRGKLQVGNASEIAEGECRIVGDSKLSVGVYKIEGRFHAIRNTCPHQGAQLCKGRLMSTHAPSKVHEYHPDLQGRVLRCPWHGWEFDIPSGKGLYDDRARVKTYPCVEDDEGVLWVEV